ncbi:MAG: ATP-dependent Zn protease [Moorea sp. SIO4A3]|nr:ATP-dependent Zn protease [Moorena sp. SIO4A3]
MQQIALNLIAIGVFGMTLSVLLGPLLNISPAIPAVTTFGVLSLVTLDGFSFQGKGLTLLLDVLASTNPEHRGRIIRHEAGHFLVAYLLGIPITGYTLSAWEALKQGQLGNGGVTFDTEALSAKASNLREMRLTLDRFCTVWMAGIAAETIVYENVEGGAEDCDKLRDALEGLGFSASEYSVKARWAERQATSMITEHWESYEALVAAMEKRASVAECYEVIQ